jgi:RimJ/RimL family protein N-acetyltransferase
MFVVNLSGVGLVLTPPTPEDVESITRCCQDEAIGRWTTMPVPYRQADAEAFVTKVVPAGWADRSPTWAIRRDPNGPVAGMIGLAAQDASAAEVGFWLDPALRGLGLMTKALNLVCDFAFRPDTLALERVEWRAFVGNAASAAVARRLCAPADCSAASAGTCGSPGCWPPTPARRLPAGRDRPRVPRRP